MRPRGAPISGGDGAVDSSSTSASGRNRKRKAPPPSIGTAPGENNEKEAGSGGGLLRRLASAWGFGRPSKIPRLEGDARCTSRTGEGAQPSPAATTLAAGSAAASRSPRPRRRSKRSRWPLGRRDDGNNGASAAAASTAAPKPPPINNASHNNVATDGKENNAPPFPAPRRSVAAVRRSHAPSDAAPDRPRLPRIEEARRPPAESDGQRRAEAAAEADDEERLLAKLRRRQLRRKALWLRNHRTHRRLCAAMRIQARCRGYAVRKRLAGARAGEGADVGDDGSEVGESTSDASVREGDEDAARAHGAVDGGGELECASGNDGEASPNAGDAAAESGLREGGGDNPQGKGVENEQQTAVGDGSAMAQSSRESVEETASTVDDWRTADSDKLQREGESGEATATVGDGGAADRCTPESTEATSTGEMHFLESGRGAGNDEKALATVEHNFESPQLALEDSSSMDHESEFDGNELDHGGENRAPNPREQMLGDASDFAGNSKPGRGGEGGRRSPVVDDRVERCIDTPADDTSAVASGGGAATSKVERSEFRQLVQLSAAGAEDAVDRTAPRTGEGAVPNIAERVKERTRRPCTASPALPVERNVGRKPTRASKLTPPRLPPPKSTKQAASSREEPRVESNEAAANGATAWSPPNNNCSNCSRLRWDLLACERCSHTFCHTCVRWTEGVGCGVTELLLCMGCYDGELDVAEGMVVPREMERVSHLCSTSFEALTGLPVEKLTVMCDETETLYDFEISIRQSSIPNAGHGAFLTYLGSRILKPKAAARSIRLLKQHEVDAVVDVMGNSLEAETPDGRRMCVKLTSANEALPPVLRPKKKKGSKARAQCKVGREVDRLRSEARGKGIGLLGIHKESDFMPSDNDELFWNYPHSLFELGRYGPHRPEDRKSLLHFNFKDFICNYEPSEWGYEVPEQMHGHRQMIDITNEFGGVHAAASQHTAIYVNEVGHNPTLHANAFIRCKFDRSIHYYIGIDRDHALRRGETVELFADYGEHYEPVRERKGYGLSALSDDAVGARLMRNFREREAIESDISSLEVAEMHRLVEFLTKDVLEPVSATGDIGPRHLVARRRLHWTGQKIEARLREYSIDPAIVSRTRELLRTWRFTPEAGGFPTALDSDLQQSYCHELAEELLYGVRLQLSEQGGSSDETFWSELDLDRSSELDSLGTGIERKRLEETVLRAAKSYALLVLGEESAGNTS